MTDKCKKQHVWGILREDVFSAIKDERTIYQQLKIDVKLTGLEIYLKEIFPETDDWIRRKKGVVLNGTTLSSIPDYRSESLKMIVEFDGVQHYTMPDVMRRDEHNTQNYINAGYEVVRIPYFIQLSKSAVKELFNVDVAEELYDENTPCLGPIRGATPAYLCHEGIVRMAKTFKRFPKQYEVNVRALKEMNDEFMTGVGLLEEEYNKL